MSPASLFGGKADLPRNSQLTPSVFIVDLDMSVRKLLQLLIREEALGFTQELVVEGRTNVRACLIVDVSLPGPNGLEPEPQQKDGYEMFEIPMIFVTSNGDALTSVPAINIGAVESLTQPFDKVALLSTIRTNVQSRRGALDREIEWHELHSRYASLTSRERQVMVLVISGFLNKQTGAELGISEITVKAHRKKVMQKMRANSLPDLVRMAEKLGLEQPLRTQSLLPVAS